MNKKTYVITGATSGIGLALVSELVRRGDVVYAGYRTEKKAEELKALSDNIVPFYVDYAKPETVLQAAEFIKSKCQKIDRLINIAGCVVAGPVENLNIDEVRRQFNVNVFGHLEMSQNLAECLNNGRIINVSSMASYGVFPFIAPYCASKKALDMFFNSYLLENKRNIKVISIKPGVIATPLWGKSIDENLKYLDKCKDYDKEMNYVLANARKNETSGLDVKEVVKVILKADSVANPKLSYTVGSDALFASILAALPQSVSNKIIKLGMRLKLK